MTSENTSDNSQAQALNKTDVSGSVTDNTIFDLQKQFNFRNDKTRKTFFFDAKTNLTNSYSISYFECDGKEVNAWIAIYNALKKNNTQLKKLWKS